MKLLLLQCAVERSLGLFDDLCGDSETEVVCLEFKRNLSRWQRELCRFHNSRIGQRLGIPFRDFWFDLSDFNAKIKTCDVVLLTSSSLFFATESLLSRCRKEGKTVCLYLLDSYDASSVNMEIVRKRMFRFHFDKIYTFDEGDARKYGFTLKDFCYYSSVRLRQIEKKNYVCDYDAVYVGGVQGGKESLISSLYERLSVAGCRLGFVVYSRGRNFFPKSIRVIGCWIPYDEVLEYDAKSNCIIEIVQRHQKGATLRYFEAVVGNKKLLSNNPEIKHFPFYDPRWMKVFERVDDIDVEWVKRQEKIEYGYKEEFSPVHLVRAILQEMCD